LLSAAWVSTSACWWLSWVDLDLVCVACSGSVGVDTRAIDIDLLNPEPDCERVPDLKRLEGPPVDDSWSDAWMITTALSELIL